MIDEQQWKETRELFNKKVKCCTFATMGPEGPLATPIGSLTLTTIGHGFFFDKFPKAMGSNLEQDNRVSILAVHPGAGFWLRSLFKGGFPSQPAIRIMGTVGPKRTPTDLETDTWLRKIRPMRRFKGYGLLWGEMRHVRDLEVSGISALNLGRMNSGLWRS